MALTADEINNVSFSIDRKGYDVDEVDVFLEHVAAEVDAMINRIADLEQELAEAQAASDAPAAGFDVEGQAEAAASVSEAQVAEYENRIADLEARLAEKTANDNAISQALIVAQRSADDIVSNARAEAANIVKDADEEADRIIGKAEGDRLKIVDSIRQLESDRTEVRSEYREMLSNFMADAQKKLAEIDGDARRATASSQVRTDMGGSAYTPSGAAPAAPAAPDSLSNPTVAADPIEMGGLAPVASPSVSGFIDKDLSGFGAADDEFAFDDID